MLRLGRTFGPLIRLAAALGLAFLFTFLVLLISGAPPLKTLVILIQGGVGSLNKAAQTVSVWVPLLLVSAALLLTFSAGLWNIGVEGQILMGAIFATGALRLFEGGGGGGGLALGLAAGLLGGALWALLAGVLRTWGGVNEIFSGLGLNFVALGMSLWLIFGPWKRPGIASMSGTEPLHESLWLSRLQGLPLAPVSLVLAVAAFLLVAVLLRYTNWGLSLRAVGQNMEAATLMGMRPKRRMLESMACCGALAGLAGALQVVGVYHRLLPSISSSYGYTGLMVAMLASLRPSLLPPICLFFAILNVGSIQLPMQLNIDSSLSGVIQGAVVLSIFAVHGLEQVIRRKRSLG